MAYEVILEPGIIGEFRGFESPQLRARNFFRGIFSCALIDLRKARERELATLDEKSTISGCEPYVQKISKAITRGGGRDDTYL